MAPTFISQVGGVGILTLNDLPPLNEAVMRVFRLMRDGNWYSSETIIDVSEQREGLRRMRELRRWYEIERAKDGGSRLWYYRLVQFQNPVQPRLLLL
jgi:hypothetical protein